MLKTVAMVAAGGAVGATLRYLTGIGLVHLLGRTHFPLTIIAVNILGSFLMGVFVVLAAERSLTHLSPLIMTGLFGGFTTFSAFSLETMVLVERGEVATAILYVVLSVGLSIAGLASGMAMMRAIYA